MYGSTLPHGIGKTKTVIAADGEDEKAAKELQDEVGFEDLIDKAKDKD